MLRRASDETIQSTFSLLQPSLRRGRWLPGSNRYAGRHIARIHDDARGANPQVDSGSLLQYAAASTLRHVGDGWGYLGTSIQAACRGDSNHSVHLAYYASLHAALCILATQGIAVLNGDHFVFSHNAAASKLISPKTRGTHEMAWLALEHWGARMRSGDIVGRIIAPGGITLSNWMAAGFGGWPWRRIGSRWFSLWGADLRRYAADRDLRNAASYRPDGLESPAPTADATAAFLLDLWTALRPSSYSPFDQLDRHLLRIAIKDSFDQTSQTGTQADFINTVDTILARVGPPPAIPSWRDFLLRHQDAADLPVITIASSASMSVHFGVIARALLLLRLATGLALELRRSSPIPVPSFEFWWLPVLRDRGLYEGAERPASALDLWTDSEASLAALSKWRASANPGTYRQLNHDVATDLHSLAGLERVAVWGLGL